MKNLGKFLKNNKHTVIVVSCCLVLTILIFTMKLVFFPSEGKALYGDRLEGISSVKIKDSTKEQIEATLKEKDEVEKASTTISGRVLNVIVTVKEDTTLETAKNLSSIVDEALDEEQQKYYDRQIFIKKTTDDEKFPIIGYHHQDSDHYSWTKDR